MPSHPHKTALQDTVNVDELFPDDTGDNDHQDTEAPRPEPVDIDRLFPDDTEGGDRPEPVDVDQLFGDDTDTTSQIVEEDQEGPSREALSVDQPDTPPDTQQAPPTPGATPSNILSGFSATNFTGPGNPAGKQMLEFWNSVGRSFMSTFGRGTKSGGIAVSQRERPSTPQTQQIMSGLGPSGFNRTARFETPEPSHQDPRENQVYQFGKKMVESADELFPNDPEVRDNLVNTTIPTLVGQQLSYAAAGLTTGGYGAVLLGSADLGAIEFNRALEESGDPEQAFDVWTRSLAIGATEGLPIASFMGRLNRATKGGVMDLLKQGFAGGLEEGVQEVFQNVLSNATARDTYDKTREILDGVGEGGGIGFGMGFAMNIMGLSLKRLRNAENISPEKVEAIDRSIELVEDKRREFEQAQNELAQAGESPGPLGGFTIDQISQDNVDQTNRSTSLATALRQKGRKALNKGEIIRQSKPEFESVSEEVAERKKEAFGVRKKSLVQRVADSATKIKNSFTRKYPKLDPKQYAVEIETLKQFENADHYATVVAYNSISDMVRDLKSSDYATFIDAVMLPDIVRDVERGLYDERPLPFGYQSKEQIEQDLQATESKVHNNERIENALNRRREFLRDLTKRMVSYNLLPEKVLEDERYYHRQVLKYMNNKEYISAGLSQADVRLKKKGFQKAREGGGDFNTAYHEAEFEWVAQAIKQIQTVEALNRLNSQANIKQQLQRQADVMSEESGEQVSWQQLIPEEYTIWQPERGNYFFTAHSVEDRVINQVLENQKELTPEDIKDVLAIGGKKSQWVIPERLAKTLDNFRDAPDQGPISRVARSINSSWKQWKLINPMRVVKYNLNNTSGDADIAMAYDPKILGGVKQATIDLFKDHRGTAPRQTREELQELIRLGVVDSGLTVKEIPDINKEGVFRALTQIGGAKNNIFLKYWKTAKSYTRMRENALRVAAYRYFLKRINNGEENIYAASNPQEIDQINDPRERAAKLSRELIGDYGNISKAGQWIRSTITPFYSWLEINLPRYYRLIKNLPKEGGDIGDTKVTASRLAKATGLKTIKAGGKLAGRMGTLGIKATAMATAISLWNQTMFPEASDELDRSRRELHLILGYRDDGSIRSLRFEGALSDALQWFDLQRGPTKATEVYRGEKELSEVIEETAKAPLNRIINASVPIPKTVTEALMGQSFYPDVFEPRTVRDPGEHISRLVDVDWIYRKVTNKPEPPISQLEKLALYRTHPEEAAYYHIRGLAFDFLDKKGKEKPRFRPTKRQNALYYFKQASKWGDDEKARFWLKEYKELGGTRTGLERSIRGSAPLGFMSKSDRREFISTMSKEDKQILNRAREWYRDVYRK